MTMESATPLHQFLGRKVLVTGASGFLGSHLCYRLGEGGAEIHAVSRSARITEARSARWWQGDMTDIATVRGILKEIKPDVIFHFSGLVTAASDLELVLPTLHSLLVSTVNILTVASETGCGRVVLAASLTEPEPNHTEATPGSPYAAAKWASSAYARMFYKLYRTPVVIVRPFMTYGPLQDVRKLIPYVTLSLLRGEPPKLSSGQWQADWIYVDDVINGLLTVAQLSGIEGCTIDLGSGVLVPARIVVRHLVRLTGSHVSPEFGALPDRPLEQVRVADTAYAHAKLGWKATTPLEEGLRRTMDWCALQLRGGVP